HALWSSHRPSPPRPHPLSLHDALPISLVFDAPGGPFTLTARADRIDVTDEGLVISDYKTGKPPSAKAVLAHEKPQLSLEAAIARSEEHTSELQSRENLVCRLLLEKKKQ